MERDFNYDDLELFIKQKADQYQMYPSDKAWRGIYLSLHSRGKWFTIGGSLLLLTALFFIGEELVFSSSSNKIVKSTTVNSKLFHPSSQPVIISFKPQVSTSN